MLHRDEIDRTYGPEALAVVGAAFDRVWQTALERTNPMEGNDDAKRALALTVLRLFDQGEREPERLAEIALREWSDTDGSTIRKRWTIGHPPARRR
jgi:hypothetical protein